MSSLISCDIDESDVFFYNDSLDSDTERAAQEAISKFFEEAPSDLFVTPDRIKNSIPSTPECIKEDEDLSLKYTCDPSTLEQEINCNTTWAQTNITLPKHLPEEVEAIIMTFTIEENREELSLLNEQESNTDQGEDSQVHCFETNSRVSDFCQTILSFPVKLPESLKTTLSVYETFTEEIYTDIRMSMMKRQLFSEPYRSSPQFHSSSPHSWVADSSPLLSGSSVTPQFSGIRPRHHGSPMGDVISPTGLSPIARPTKISRFLSKLDFVGSHLEEASSSPPIVAFAKGAAAASSSSSEEEEEEDNSRN